ncbi:NAD(P)/FAD-dependent oxidoreductase [uncultured Adlercreutzia sp.]|uniref:NAD(P)/FAD-dependent oxidoreductase n=1 Tax=uncultured Adlercreutzia sp. TaxID=875803 RepID=UPI0026751A69|nr:NAD(P)/FAD-dependent oxidoreductase [uncultured Adlercreutzia sp.]
MKTIAIIGGGAAGLAAAVAAAETVRDAGAGAGSDAEVRVTVYEASDRVGRSILATGNGRCNFSNAVIDASRYRNAAFVEETLGACEATFCEDGESAGAPAADEPLSGVDARAKALNAMSCADAVGAWNVVLRFFSDRGLMWREEGEGRLYPLANKATSVLDCLRAACVAAGVRELVESEVAAVEAPRGEGDRFTLRLADRRLERADAVIAAVGGAAGERLLPAGVPFRAMAPTLGPIATDPRWPRQLDNIRVRGALELWRPGEGMSLEACRDAGFPPDEHLGERLVAREVGEVMFRKYGVSGIAAFNLSRLMEPGDRLAVDFVPGVRLVDMAAFLNRRRKMLFASLGRSVTWEDMLRGMVLAPVADVLLKAVGLRGGDETTKESAAKLACVLKGLRLPVTGLGDERQCQVRRGGVDVAAIDAHTCEAREMPGLYVVGEALDVDAPCGGYNLHWAWASGLLAGRSAVEALR